MTEWHHLISCCLTNVFSIIQGHSSMQIKLHTIRNHSGTCSVLSHLLGLAQWLDLIYNELSQRGFTVVFISMEGDAPETLTICSLPCTMGRLLCIRVVSPSLGQKHSSLHCAILCSCTQFVSALDQQALVSTYTLYNWGIMISEVSMLIRKDIKYSLKKRCFV